MPVPQAVDRHIALVLLTFEVLQRAITLDITPAFVIYLFEHSKRARLRPSGHSMKSFLAFRPGVTHQDASMTIGAVIGESV